jgi:hypothetical protein
MRSAEHAHITTRRTMLAGIAAVSAAGAATATADAPSKIQLLFEEWQRRKSAWELSHSVDEYSSETGTLFEAFIEVEEKIGAEQAFTPHDLWLKLFIYREVLSPSEVAPYIKAEGDYLEQSFFAGLMIDAERVLAGGCA